MAHDPERVLDAGPPLGGWAGDADVEVVIVGGGSSRLDEQLGGARAERGGGADSLSVPEKPRADPGRNEDVRHARDRVGEERGDELPIARVVEAGAGDGRREALRCERYEAVAEEGLVAAIERVEAEIGIAPALVRVVPIDVAAVTARQVPDAEDRARKALGDAAAGAVDEPDERRQTPAYVLVGVERHDAQVRRRSEVRAVLEPPLVRGADRHGARRRGRQRGDPVVRDGEGAGEEESGGDGGASHEIVHVAKRAERANFPAHGPLRDVAPFPPAARLESHPMPLDEQQRARIAPYVSNLDRDVFAVAGLPEEVIAVLFAYYSRSRDDLRTNLARLLGGDELDVGAAAQAQSGVRLASDKARAFHEKWVVGYGHASVAEHAVVHLALENVSIVASKAIEDLRLGSYTEKSTRYVVFDTHSFVERPELGAVYRENGERLFSTYLELFPKVEAALRERVPRKETQTEAGYKSSIRATALDLLRGLLPAGTRTNLGLTANARALEILVSKMLSSPLAEIRELGAAMLREATTVTPTLLKYAARNPYRESLPATVGSALAASPTARAEPSEARSGVRLVRSDDDALARIALALAYEGSDGSAEAVDRLRTLQQADRDALVRLVRAALEGRGKFDPPPRAFEASSLTCELTCDYGAYRDLQRHRMLSPFTQRLGCRLGAEVPAELDEMGLAGPFRDALARAADTFARLEATHPLEAQYAVPLAYRVRTLWTLNVRELFHVCELRSSRQGHPSYRRLAQALYRAACDAHPWLEGLVRVDLGDYPLTRP